METIENWPNDADGDVFRSLNRQKFDFLKDYVIDFNVDFENNVPEGVVKTLKKNYPNANVIDNSKEDPPYFQVQIRAKVKYDYVIKVQSELTSAMKPFGGWCDSWGILH